MLDPVAPEVPWGVTNCPDCDHWTAEIHKPVLHGDEIDPDAGDNALYYVAECVCGFSTVQTVELVSGA